MPMSDVGIDYTKPSSDTHNTSGITETDVESHQAEDHHDGLNDVVFAVNLGALKSAELMFVPVVLQGEQMTGLIDTGAKKSLLRESVSKRVKLETETDVSLTIQGLGRTNVRTLGRTRARFGIIGQEVVQSDFEVLPDEALAFDIVVGRRWLKRNRFAVDMSKKKLIRENHDGSRTDWYFKENGELRTVVNERIPVVATSTVTVRTDGVAEVPIAIHKDLWRWNHSDEYAYFEGADKAGKTSCLDGILDVQQDQPRIVVRCEARSGQSTVRKGQIVGRVSTLVELDQETPEEEEQEDWTAEVLKQKIPLGDHMSENQKDKVYARLAEGEASMSRGDRDIGRARVIPHRIELTDHTPIWQKPRSFSEPVNNELENQCKDLLTWRVIEPSQSRWSSPIVPVRKKDGQLRMCIDYRRLNTVTKTDNFPMPNLNDCVYGAHNTEWFTKIDLVKGYYQIPLDEGSREYTAFSTSNNQYQFRTLSFGLKNSGIAFQRNMQQILSEYSSQNVMIYIDDILIMSKSFEEHLDLVGRVLNTLKQNGIKIKLSKCEFFVPEVSFLGHIINKKGIQKSPEYMDKIKDYPKPKTVTELRRFLGLVNFQRKFVNQCSVIAKPLTQLTGGQKSKKLTWTREMDESFDKLKDELVKEVLLSFPDYSPGANMLELFVDASGAGAGACLVQKQGEEYKTIGYSSMTFSPAQSRYSTIERELLAIRWGVSAFRSFLYFQTFVLYTDHKPLLYLHNMGRENSRLAGTIHDLADYDFIIKYRPGAENSAADAMSRIMRVPSSDEYPSLVNSRELPKGLRVLKEVEGGGNSMFVSLMLCLEDMKTEYEWLSLPDDHVAMRKEVSEELLQNATKYNIKINRETKKRLSSMRNEGQLPCEEALLAVCRLYNVEVWVHHGMSSPVVYKVEGRDEQVVPKLHLQCVSGIHFNPVYSKQRDDVLVALVAEKCVNIVPADRQQTENVAEVEQEISEERLEKDRLVMLVNLHKLTKVCNHPPPPETDCIANVGGVRFCTIVDTGAQISVMTESLYNHLHREDPSLQMDRLSGATILGINGEQTRVLGVVVIRIRLLNLELKRATPYAVVEDRAMPCCVILGANFLIMNEIVFDCMRSELYVEDQDGECLRYPLQDSPSAAYDKSSEVCVFVGSMLVVDDSSELGEDETLNLRFVIDQEDLVRLQDADYVVGNLKTQIAEGIPCKDWQLGCLNRFKRFQSCLRVVAGLLLVRRGVREVPVITFSLLVEVVFKVHNRLAHIGRQKLFDIVQKHFWHPALDRVSRDVTTSCGRCQIYKIASNVVAPPILKIQTSYPFELVAMDLLQLQKTPRGHVALLVTVDHFSKFVMAVPLKNKTAVTVARALSEQVLPHIVRVPSRVLTDNGPEFRAVEFNRVLDSYNITHVYSTRYRAAGNGAVERVNRTITEMLRSLVRESSTAWDERLQDALIIYNSTVHSQTGSSPSDLILSRAHEIGAILPVSRDVVDRWSDGHPRFESYSLGQKVIRKVARIGKLLKYKLEKRYEGPFEVVKVQSNGVTYEIKECITGVVTKAHHCQLRPWYSPPMYLRNYLRLAGINNDGLPACEQLSSDSSDDEVPIGVGSCESDTSSDSDTDGSLSEDDSRGGDDGAISKESVSRVVCADESSGSIDFDQVLKRFGVTGRRSVAVDGTRLSGVSRESTRVSDGKPVGMETRAWRSLSAGGNVPEMQLSRLHCSEPVSENNLGDGILQEVLGSLRAQHNEYRRVRDAMDWEISNDGLVSMGVEQVSEGEVTWRMEADLRASTPVKSATATVDIGEKTRAQKDESLRDFLQWLTQSVNGQEELLDDLCRGTADGSAGNAKRVSEVEPVTAEETEFEGFGSGEREQVGSVAKLKVLQRLKNQLRLTRVSIADFGSSQTSRTGSWRTRQVLSVAKSSTETCVEDEICDILTDLPIIDTPRVPRRMTRSAGPVEEYPNVQPRPIEFKKRRKLFP